MEKEDVLSRIEEFANYVREALTNKVEGGARPDEVNDFMEYRHNEWGNDYDEFAMEREAMIDRGKYERY